MNQYSKEHENSRMSVKNSFNDRMWRSRSSCQTSKCEEDDSYVRKPRRQAKRTVRSDFPSLHWLILPLHVRVYLRKESFLNGFSSWSISDKLLSAGASRNLPALVATVVQCCHLKKRNKMGRRSKVSQKHWFCIQHTGCQKGCLEVYLGNLAVPSVHFQELVISSWSQLT